MNRFALFLRNVFHKRKVEGELRDELGFHLEMQIKENMQHGMDEQEARRQAVLQLGGVEQAKESVRHVRNSYFLDTLMQDLRYAVRSLLRQPGFLAIALLILTIGIGANVRFARLF